jgi:hypothetical protein
VTGWKGCWSDQVSVELVLVCAPARKDLAGVEGGVGSKNRIPYGM